MQLSRADRCGIPPAQHRRRGFTLVEAVVVMTITALAASLILLTMETTVQTTDAAVEQTIATGMAEQIIDEVMGKRYMATTVGPYQYPLGPSGWESNGNGRERFDDTDDFLNFQTFGAKDIWGQPLGEGNGAGGLRHPNFRTWPGYFAKWRQQIQVYYVSDTDLSQRLPAWRTSNHRAVEVTILRQQPNGSLLELAKMRRVYAYVPSQP